MHREVSRRLGRRDGPRLAPSSSGNSPQKRWVSAFSLGTGTGKMNQTWRGIRMVDLALSELAWATECQGLLLRERALSQGAT